MSLSRILNDDSPPGPSLQPSVPSTLPAQSAEEATLPSQPLARSQHPPVIVRPLQSSEPVPPEFVRSGQLDPSRLPANSGNLETPASLAAGPSETPQNESPSAKRKRKTPANPDEPQRRSTRKRGAKQKQSVQDATSETHPSSDLEDCATLWTDELHSYKKHTQSRKKEVSEWFEASVLENNSTSAQRISHMYAQKIARVPLDPPPNHLHLASGLLDGSNESDVMDDTSELNGGNHVHGMSPNASHQFSSAVKGKGRAPTKRSASLTRSEVDTMVPSYGHPEPEQPALKKRKMEPVDPPEGLLPPLSEVSASHTRANKTRSKAPFAHPPDLPDIPSQAVKPSASRKRNSLKKKGLGNELEFEVNHGFYAGEGTPAMSRQSSPAPGPLNVVYELSDHIPPLPRAKRMDEAGLVKRIRALEENQRKVWTNIAKKDIVKVYRYHTSGFQARQAQSERLAKLASVQARRPFAKTPKSTKDVQTKAKRMMREMGVFWKKNEKEERDVRKRENKEAKDRMKAEEERREASRQARKLEFLISQTELYSHFVGSKLKTAEVEGQQLVDGSKPAGADLADFDGHLPDIDFDDADHTNLHRHARQNAQEALEKVRQRAADFDAQAALSRPPATSTSPSDEEEANAPAGPLLDLDSDELNFQNPTSLSGPLTIGQPKILNAQLKEYQLKGLNWLATLYEQGINGILADEMGLGKTVQSISLLAYLAETHNIWGPFLVVAPASTLHNWQQELSRFLPTLKALPYWGNIKDRATLRKVWSKKDMAYHRDSPFHVIITSYQMVTQDQQYFQRIKWQYMILDEAQNIKNSSSNRWKTLLGFHCRNRLLLTGTPIQNNMQELWALLHFIMPSLFDSHDEFNEWFSKDIETAAENRGSKLSDHQLKRLHMILKPFMLRRVKRHVQNELSEKIELDIYVDLSPRQRALYRALLANVSVAELLQKAATLGDAESARSLMNLVMHFRKVCNHPELFERADVVSPFSFTCFGQSGPLNREGDLIMLPDSSRNPISLQIPELLYHQFHVPTMESPSSKDSVYRKFDIWSPGWIQKSICDEFSPASFAFLRLLQATPEETHEVAHASAFQKRLISLIAPDVDPLDSRVISPNLPSRELGEISIDYLLKSCLSRPILQWRVPPAVAPPISLYCTDRTFVDSQSNLLEAPVESLALYGLPPGHRESPSSFSAFNKLCPGVPPLGLLGASPEYQVPVTPMHMPEAKRLIYDSGKLARLDALLQELKANDHRVLVYFQMTRMMDLMEEYLIYRQYKYLRLDGSSKLEDRRDMVNDWQTRDDIFVFILSTKAGGLGINLTAADTVVFYDHDWNPSNDAQAMDRAHRLGQTRQVTVYRLITKGTIDERIVQLARVKKDVQDIVVGNKTFTDATKPSEIVHLLLNDEQIASMGTSTDIVSKDDQPSINAELATDWNDEGDDFFGSSGMNNGNAVLPEPAEEEHQRASTSTRGRKRGRGGGQTRGRKPGPKKKANAGS